MAKSAGTSVKDAIKQFEALKGCVAAEAEKVELWGRVPPIEKLDATLATLKNCRHLALSSNNISKITGLTDLPKLQILSLARNSLLRIEGLDAVGSTLDQLWLSYNQISKLAGLENCDKLRVLYVANNMLKDFKDLDGLPPTLEELSLQGNPLYESAKADGPPAAIGSTYRCEVLRHVPGLKKLDGVAVDPEERDQARLHSSGGLGASGLGQTSTRLGAVAGSAAPSRGVDSGGLDGAGPRPSGLGPSPSTRPGVGAPSARPSTSGQGGAT